MYDAALDLEDEDLSGAPFFIQSLLITRAIAYALTGLCHLSQGKKFISAFMKLYTQKSNDPSLRPPNMKEAQSADREFWSEVFRLVNEDPQTWSIEASMIEVLTVRNHLNIHMMQRPKPMGKGGTFLVKGKGKQKGKGKEKEKVNTFQMDSSRKTPTREHHGLPIGLQRRRKDRTFVTDFIFTTHVRRRIAVSVMNALSLSMANLVEKLIVLRTTKTDRYGRMNPVRQLR